MPISLDVVVGSPEYEMDMKAGLDTLQGASDTTRIISETLLTGHVPERRTYKSSVRTTLRRSFKGSYGQIFRLDILDEDLKKEYRKIGSTAFTELISYFINEALYIEQEDLSEKSQRIVENLGDTADLLVRLLRKSPLRNVHEISTKFGYNVTLRHRKNYDNMVSLASFDQQTSQAILAKRTDESLNFKASIRRLNTNTGNGRLQLEGADETVAFGFRSRYSDVDFATKKKFSENLDRNNGIDIDNWKYLDIKANPIKLPDGRVIKYIIKGFHDEDL
ncbi:MULTISPECIES: hypothetical protein [unclassified Pseudomonas]|jgi:hypothetical protein|uniref:hypothetical protein n=1 Tax=unclassified Pseudomonas TaxID=196821 RepID=UPI0010688287|nr:MULTISPECIES: hypothetical protein [unclassified Pseudomonas]TFA83850.1 hypothetical protein F638_3903 [Pseudomonas sp. LAIL14HWK12:I2]